MDIREESVDDRSAIRHVHEEAFGGNVEARLVDLLREGDKALVSVVAKIGGRVVGHALLSTATVVGAPDVRAAGLAPVGVLPAFQNKGVGSALVREGLNRSIQAGCDLVVVVGDPAYYRRFGFQSARTFGFENAYGVGDEFMVLELREGGLPKAGGLVQYAPEFAEAESLRT
jgi:putative acetyltransferase